MYCSTRCEGQTKTVKLVWLIKKSLRAVLKTAARFYMQKKYLDVLSSSPEDVCTFLRSTRSPERAFASKLLMPSKCIIYRVI